LEFSIGLERRREAMEMLYILLAISLEEEEEGERGRGVWRRKKKKCFICPYSCWEFIKRRRNSTNSPHTNAESQQR
jgi:hypothetical protein